jgi:metallo-beta-lactamase class B
MQQRTSGIRLATSLAMVVTMGLADAQAQGSPHSQASNDTPIAEDPPSRCSSCTDWNRPREPFRIFGNTYYVGVANLSAILISGEGGHILLDGGLTQSAGQIAASIAKLGFRLEDVELILSSHAHFDHAGGIAALRRATGARVAASAAGAEALRKGGPTEDDPQFVAGGNEVDSFPPVPEVRAVANGETLRVGELAITAHLTPGHTPGSTAWTWRSCEGSRCVDLVYADSLSAVSAPGFRFTAGGPVGVEVFTRSFGTVERLPCDVLLTPHSWDFDMDGKLKRRTEKPDVNPFIQPGECQAYAARARKNLQRRVEEEKAGRRNSGP